MEHSYLPFRRHKSRAKLTRTSILPKIAPAKTAEVLQVETSEWKSEYWQEVPLNERLASEKWRRRIWANLPETIIREYRRIPRNYTDATGLSIGGNLGADEIRKIFGVGIGIADGNRLLRIIHGRRVAGSLNHPEYAHNTAKWPQKTVYLALSWLRQYVPVDETVNMSLRAEEELFQIEREQQRLQYTQDYLDEVAEKRRDKSYAIKNKHQSYATPQVPKANEETEKKSMKQERKGAQTKEQREKVFIPDPIYGYSPIDEERFRRRIEAGKRAEAAEKERKKKLLSYGLKEEQVGELMALPDDKIHFKVFPREMSPKMKEFQRQGQSDLKEPPKMSFWKRFGQSYLFALALLGLAWTAGQWYTPPRQHERLLPNVPFALPPVLTIAAFVFGVYCMWKIPHTWRFMNRYFVLSPALPRPSQILLSPLSHQTVNHLFFNLTVFVLVGVPLCDALGLADFLATCLTTGVAGSIAGLTSYGLRGMFHVSTQGMSAISYGLTITYFWLTRNDRISFGVRPEQLGQPEGASFGIPGWAFLIFIIGINGWELYRGHKTVDFAGHWAGMLAGWLIGMYQQRKIADKMKQKEQSTLSAK